MLAIIAFFQTIDSDKLTKVSNYSAPIEAVIQDKIIGEAEIFLIAIAQRAVIWRFAVGPYAENTCNLQIRAIGNDVF